MAVGVLGTLVVLTGMILVRIGLSSSTSKIYAFKHVLCPQKCHISFSPCMANIFQEMRDGKATRMPTLMVSTMAAMGRCPRMIASAASKFLFFRVYS